MINSDRMKDIDIPMHVGVGRVDITPIGPIRLTGFAARTNVETDNVMGRLSAKALAFGKEARHTSLIITVDLITIGWRITAKLVDRLSKDVGIPREQIAILASHTHGSPELGDLINCLHCTGDYPYTYSFSDSLLTLDHLVHIAEYTEWLSERLEEVARTALHNRRPALVAWGIGTASFAANRRTNGGPVDHSLPLLRVTDTDGRLRAVWVNYACHGISLGPEVNAIHGDWMGTAQHEIEARHPGAIAMVAIGCAGDIHPQLRDDISYTMTYAREIADSVDRLLIARLRPLTVPPVGTMRWLSLPFSTQPTVGDLLEQVKDKTVRGFYARLALERLQRGETLPSTLDYPIQTWCFGDGLVMINMGGEVVADYAVRLKRDLDGARLWINSYSNDVSCYIASRRVLQEGGYEADDSMQWYNKPSPLADDVEDLIIDAVHAMVPARFK